MAIPLMAILGAGSALAGLSGALSNRDKRRGLIDDAYNRAEENLEAAQNMDIPELERQDFSDATGAAQATMDIGMNQARTGLSSSEISMLTNRALGNRPTLGGGAAPVGSLFRRLSQGQGMLELGSALADARQQGVANIANAGQLFKSIADSKAQESSQVYGVESRRYDAIQQAAGEAFAQQQANQLASVSLDEKLNTQIGMMGFQAVAPTLNKIGIGNKEGGGFGFGNMDDLI